MSRQLETRRDGLLDGAVVAGGGDRTRIGNGEVGEDELFAVFHRRGGGSAGTPVDHL